MAAPITVTLPIDGMSCASCSARVSRALDAAEGVDDAAVNLVTGTARFRAAGPEDLAGAVAMLDELGYPAQRREARFRIANLTCSSCVGRAQRALASVPGVLAATVNLATETASVTYLEGATDLDALAEVSRSAGYPVEIINRDPAQPDDTTRQAEAAEIRRQAVWAGLLTLPIFILEMGGHLVPAFHHAIAQSIGTGTSWLIQGILATAVLAGPGRLFFSRGIPALMRGAPDMNSLVALGTGAAWGFSMVALAWPSLLPAATRAVYFEAAAVIVTLILVGRWLEARAKGRAGAAIQGLLGLKVRTARVMRNGVATDIDIDDVQTGDTILIRPGERVPADGTVLDGASRIDESMMTGEPAPVAKAAGDPVTGGTVNGSGGLTVRVTRTGQDTTLAQIVRMVEEAQGAQLPIQALVDRVTLWFVPAVLSCAALTVILWLIIGPDPAISFALVAGVSVLIIACPCAMGLATPTSILVGTGRAAELGVLFRKGDALEVLNRVDVIAFDKTGTLTMGRPAMTDLVAAPGIDPDEVLRRVAAVEARSEHPVATAILDAARQQGHAIPEAEDFSAVAGYGVEGRVDGKRVQVGAERLMTRAGIAVDAFAPQAQARAARGETVLYAAIDGRLAVMISVSDPVKAESQTALSALAQRGYDIAMITGDKRETAEAIARDIGISHVIAEVLPDGKVDALATLKAQGRKVAFVGDGINDAPALAFADVGIAIGTGTDIAIETADVVLMSGDLRGVVNAVNLSRRTMRNIRQNLAWAFGYNTALIPVAAGILYPAFGVLLSPVFAAGAMALSSVSVVTNALRLRRIRPAMQGAAMPAAPRLGPVNQPAE